MVKGHSEKDKREIFKTKSAKQERHGGKLSLATTELVVANSSDVPISLSYMRGKISHGGHALTGTAKDTD